MSGFRGVKSIEASGVQGRGGNVLSLGLSGSLLKTGRQGCLCGNRSRKRSKNIV